MRARLSSLEAYSDHVYLCSTRVSHDIRHSSGTKFGYTFPDGASLGKAQQPLGQ